MKSSAKRTARKSALTAGAVLAFLVAVGFLSSALWISLAWAYDPMAASLILGFGYLGVGLVLISIATTMGNAATAPEAKPENPDKAQDPPQPPGANLPPLAQAFLYGLDAGFKAGPKR